MNQNPVADFTPQTGAAGYREVLQQRRAELHAELAPMDLHKAPFTWELGCGHGHFLTAYAEAHPDKLCIGIDIVSERIQRALRKRDRAKLGNLFFVRAEASLFLETLSAGAVFAELFILFPDPWPKVRHHKHRVIQPKFLSAAARRATPNGQLCFRTDSRAYFEHAHGVLAGHPSWQFSTEAWPFEFRTVFQSRASEFQSLVARRVQSDER